MTYFICSNSTQEKDKREKINFLFFLFTIGFTSGEFYKRTRFMFSREFFNFKTYVLLVEKLSDASTIDCYYLAEEFSMKGSEIK